MSDKKLDTGTGGFTLGNNDTKVYTYDVGVVRDVVEDGDWSPGAVNVDPQLDSRDLSVGTKTTLGQYLSNTTKGLTPTVPKQARGKGNRFTVPDVNAAAPYSEFSTTDETGFPVGPNAVPDIAYQPDLGRLNDVPASLVTSQARPTLPSANWFDEKTVAKVSRGMLRKDPNKANDIEDKIFDGNNLLKDAVDNNKKQLVPNSPIANYSNSLYKNRWSSANKFVPGTSGNGKTVNLDPSRELLSRTIGAVKYIPGQSYTPEDYTSTVEDNKLKFVSQRQLASAAPVLMARASSELGAGKQGLDPNNNIFEANAALLPGTAQLGAQKVAELTLQLQDVLQDLSVTTDGVQDESLTSIAPGIPGSESADLQSWGSYNNPYDQFTGFGALGSQVLAVAFVTAIGLIPGLIQGIFAFGNTPKTGDGSKQELDSLGRLPIGRYRTIGRGIPNLTAAALLQGIISGQLNWADLLGFDTTVFPLNRCINAGTLAFYGLYSDTAAGAFTSVSGPEAYIVFSRAISRSFLTISVELQKTTKSFEISPLSGAQSVLSFIEFFRRSKLMRSLNTFAQLGDQILREDSSSFDKAAKGFGLKKSVTDSLGIDPSAVITKSRLVDNTTIAGPNGGDARSLRHAWSTFRAPDLLILPQGLAIARQVDKNLGVPGLSPSVEVDSKVGIRPLLKFGADNNQKTLSQGIYYPTSDSLDRIPTEVRETLETALDAEYMPFYFHDVRTNEIISFHAFLTNLADGFTAAYDSVEAYGRVEPIKTYKGTTRKVDVGFQLAALSPEDFDSMWIKINKLTTMVYPQFSRGSFAESDKFKVTIPFSQQIAAAPMIRLRIGDLIQSNYSRFNLARLFGYSYGETNLTSQGGTPQDQKSEAFLNNVAGKADNTANRVKYIFKTKGELDFQAAGEPSYIKNTARLPRGLLLKIVDGFKNENDSGKVEVVIDDRITDAEAIAEIKRRHDKNNGVSTENRYLGAQAVVSNLKNLLVVYSKDAKDSDAPKAPNAANYQATFEQFMEPANNSVVRSFQSAGGRGLPGFIESLSFDWYGGTVWEEEPGKRAPKLCKVTVSFSPFQDITPGLDHKGADRAPVYPIGPLKPSRF